MTEDRNLAACGLGLPRDEVILRPHDPRWAPCFESEAAVLRESFTDIGLTLDHVGSTSIPGIAAKPVIDMLGQCRAVEALDERVDRLSRLGYESKGEYGIAGRRYCVRYDVTKTVGYIHLHVFADGHEEVRRHLFFRDYLRAHPEAAAEYAELKTDLQQRFPRERGAYLDGKSGFIRSVLARLPAST